jgi:hydrogenase expression/formation protein HypD
VIEPLKDCLDRLQAAAQAVAVPIRIMEVCGTHTVAIFRHGIRSLLPANLKLISGPGCPVCVTSQGFIEAAVHLAGRQGMIMATYGDMMRVPGANGNLERARANGARVEVVLSARDALNLAQHNPDAEVVFLAVGFETTTPATAEVVLSAHRRQVRNFSVLAAHKRIVPAMLALLAGEQVAIDAFLCPGHVSVIVGSDAYRPVVARFAKGCVVAGFEPVQIMCALAELAEMVASQRPELDNAYKVVVSDQGNHRAQEMIAQVFEPGPATWRGLGQIDHSGLNLKRAYRDLDAFERFGLSPATEVEIPGCRCGDVIRGVIDPPQCPLFGAACTPSQPVGPCMVSSEGTCQAWWKYQRVSV